MKVCEHCGEEIGTRDGDSLCDACERAAENGQRRKSARSDRRSRESALRSCGLVKVRGALGGTYWE